MYVGILLNCCHAVLQRLRGEKFSVVSKSKKIKGTYKAKMTQNKTANSGTFRPINILKNRFTFPTDFTRT
jgi:hypothetical protein